MFLLQNILENAIPIKAVIMFENSLIRMLGPPLDDGDGGDGGGGVQGIARQ